MLLPLRLLFLGGFFCLLSVCGWAGEPSSVFVADSSGASAKFLAAVSADSSANIANAVRGFEFNTTQLFSSHGVGVIPQDGVFGPICRRISVYVSNQVERVAPLDFVISGATRRAFQVHHFVGRVHVSGVYRLARSGAKDTVDSLPTTSTHSAPAASSAATANASSARPAARTSLADSSLYTLVADVIIREDEDEDGAGVFVGTFAATVSVALDYQFLFNSLRRVVSLAPEASAADPLRNRTFVGLWRSYQTGTILSASWGDGRLPFVPDDFYADGSSSRPSISYTDEFWERKSLGRELIPVKDSEGNVLGLTCKEVWW